MLAAMGTDASVARVWDLKACRNVATFKGHTAAVTSLAFSGSGYHMATASADGTVRVWDLRKLEELASIAAEAAVGGVAFDSTGAYLAVAARDVRVFAADDSWQPVVALDDATDSLAGVAFTAGAAGVVTAGKDRVVRVYGSK